MLTKFDEFAIEIISHCVTIPVATRLQEQRNMSQITGGCLCKAVQFSIDGPLRPIIACHCSQCRKQTGSYVAATSVALSDITIQGEEAIAWFSATPDAKRGFCKTCGSVLFWKPEGKDRISIMVGALNGRTGLSIEKHIFVADKPDWYEILDSKPQDPA
jgi:hypothetical protein